MKGLGAMIRYPQRMHSFSEAAIERRRERMAFVERFPGRLRGWAEAAGKTVHATAEIADGVLVVFADGTYLPAGPTSPSVDDLQSGLLAARSALEAFHAEAFAELDRLLAVEQEAMRLARMEKVIGAVKTNLPNIPELREELQRLLDDEGIRNP